MLIKVEGNDDFDYLDAMSSRDKLPFDLLYNQHTGEWFPIFTDPAALPVTVTQTPRTKRYKMSLNGQVYDVARLIYERHNNLAPAEHARRLVVFKDNDPTNLAMSNLYIHGQRKETT